MDIVKRIGANKMSEKITSKVGNLIRDFRISAGMTQKKLASLCGLNESTIRNYELGNRYPDNQTLVKIASTLNVSFYSLADINIDNPFSALHALFEIEKKYGLRPTIKKGTLELCFDKNLEDNTIYPNEEIDAFRIMLENWAKLRDKLDDEIITKQDYYTKQAKFPATDLDNDTLLSSSLDLNDENKDIVVEKTYNGSNTNSSNNVIPYFTYSKRKTRKE